jgi:hypothetical protein
MSGLTCAGLVAILALVGWCAVETAQLGWGWWRNNTDRGEKR